MSDKTVFLVLTSALVIEGALCRAGTLVEVSEAEAKNFLHRGRARLATAEDGIPAEQEAAEVKAEQAPEPTKPKKTGKNSEAK